MSQMLKYVDKKVCLIITDGRNLVGTLTSCDWQGNIILSDTVERKITPAEWGQDSEEIAMGVLLVRGDTIVLCGLIDEERDESIDWTKVHGDIIGTTKRT
ncbi:Sm-like ribonucleoprotein [Pseudovirgaria hyperparasitica]|uniref:LSM2-LSM8 complex subunit LSM8 n=1 Tax=Pseudovirgaria hyperparasitica TaxID=470096 RepID=A0A6A6VTE5_9PEZI|nr:Sm-like ribonucleoprotein [Pseudovirgaria hyperparasitica]KAF2753852.1 Sm-like ribonucleoprotein [Pseudovirgaria hyperparasitica]